jgi:hypothetical protein
VAAVAIVDKRQAIRRHMVLPVVCDRCGDTSRLTRAEEPTRAALLQMGYYRGFLRELELLERAERLFARFPGSRHPLIAEHLDLQPGAVPTALDEEFERALREDAELHEFLTGSPFLLAARLQVVRESVASYSGRVAEFQVACPVCGTGSLCLEQGFFERLG